MQPITRLQLAAVQCNRHAPFEQRRGGRRHIDTLARDRTRGAGAFAPHLQRHVADAVIVTGVDVHRHDTGRTDGGIRDRRHDRNVRSLVRHDRERQGIRQFRRQRRGISLRRGRRDPAPAAVVVERENGRYRRPVHRGREAHRIATIGEHRITRATAQHRRNPHVRTTRDSQRRHRLHRFVGTTEICGIVSEQRDITDPTAVGHRDNAVQFRRTSIVHADGDRCRHGAERQRGESIRADPQRGVAPCLALGTTRNGHAIASLGAHAQRHRHATRDERRQLLESQRRQQRAAPSAHWMHRGREAIGCLASRPRQRAHGDRGHDAGHRHGTTETLPHLRRQHPRRQSTRHILGRARTKHAGAGHFERPAQ